MTPDWTALWPIVTVAAAVALILLVAWLAETCGFTRLADPEPLPNDTRLDGGDQG